MQIRFPPRASLIVILSFALFAGPANAGEIPIPEPRPEIAAPRQADPSKREAEPVEREQVPAARNGHQQPEATLMPMIEKEDPAAFSACTGRLKALGVVFEEIGRIDESNGCGIDRPIEVRDLGGGVSLDPPGRMRCETALQLSLWMRDAVAPMLGKAKPDETLATINQASTYICRKRNNARSGKISEHARGNAVDVAGFTFKSGRTLTIGPRQRDGSLEGALQRAIAAAACLYFTTVLDPGSDKAHETHLHLDTLKRKAGYRYCW